MIEAVADATVPSSSVVEPGSLVLHTNDPRCGIRFEGFALFHDEYRCLVSVRAHEFGCEQHPFWVGLAELRQFREQLDAINRFVSLDRAAELACSSTPDWIRFSMNRAGHVSVEGRLETLLSRLEFRFETDQTVLTPLLRDVEKLLSTAATM